MSAEETSAQLAALRAIVRRMGSALVAYSGGVDSAVVLAVAHAELHPGAVGCIAVSPSYPRRELRAAVGLARALGAPIRILRTREHRDAGYLANRQDRCYFCKAALYDALAQVARREAFAAILNGTHADDVDDHVHGMAAARRWGVRSPLLEAGLRKQDVRALANHLGLAVWDKPASPCLSSRVPHGTPITRSVLRQIERAEDALLALGFARVRVRHHGSIARVELPVEDLHEALAQREQLVRDLRRAGYQRVTLDLTGLRGESLPQPLVQVRVCPRTDTAPARVNVPLR